MGGEVYGGSMPRTVKKIETDSWGEYPGGDFKFELDLSKRNFVMELDGEEVIIDSNLGDFEYSPIVFSNITPPLWLPFFNLWLC